MNGKNPDIDISEASEQTMENTSTSSGFGLPHGPLPMPPQQLERQGGLMKLLRIYGLVAVRK